MKLSVLSAFLCLISAISAFPESTIRQNVGVAFIKQKTIFPVADVQTVSFNVKIPKRLQLLKLPVVYSPCQGTDDKCLLYYEELHHTRNDANRHLDSVISLENEVHALLNEFTSDTRSRKALMSVIGSGLR